MLSRAVTDKEQTAFWSHLQDQADTVPIYLAQAQDTVNSTPLNQEIEMIMAKVFHPLSSSCLPAVIVPLSNQDASGPGKFRREVLCRGDIVPHLVHREVAPAGEAVNESLSIRH